MREVVRPEDASYAEIRINALLKFIKHIDNCIPNFIDLIHRHGIGSNT